MSNNHDAQERTTPPETFIEHVKDVLEHLYDFPYLQHHSLTQELKVGTKGSSDTAGQRLRRQVIGAIDTLDPGPDVSFRAPPARLYTLLQLHYVEGLTIQEAAHELGVSQRQAYRDLRRGEASVAAVLWARRSHSEKRRASQLSSVQSEITQLETHSRLANVHLLVERARQAVAQLALQQDVELDVEIPPDPMIISTDPVMAQQVLVSILSRAVQQTQTGKLSLVLRASKGQAVLDLCYTLIGETEVVVIDYVVEQLIDRLKWSIKQEEQPENIRIVSLCMTSRGPTVLVIDDNKGLVELLDRYLTDHACRVVAATSGQEGLRLAQELMPDAIILDVMMPEMDGWEILQILRTRPQTTSIPVVICSVFDDPELAHSLGASLFLPKPVSRGEVLSALHQLDVV